MVEHLAINQEGANPLHLAPHGRPEKGCLGGQYEPLLRFTVHGSRQQGFQSCKGVEVQVIKDRLRKENVP